MAGPSDPADRPVCAWIRSGPACVIAPIHQQKARCPVRRLDKKRGIAAAFALASVHAKAPMMVPADQLISVKLALSKQRALMWTAPLESSPASRRLHGHNIESVCRQRMRPIAVKLIDVGNADK